MILNPDNTYNANGLTIKEFLLTKHNSNNIDMPNKKRKKTVGVTIHNTESISVSSSTTPAEQYVRATKNGNMRDVRVHFYVDDYCAWQCMPLDEINWSCADGTSNPNSGNNTTIAIEVIGNSSKAEENAIKLTAYLLKKYNLNVNENLFTHTHWMNVRDGRTGSIDYLNTAYNANKNCPIYILPHWSTFKNKVQQALNKLNNKITEPISINDLYRVRKTWTDHQSQIGAFASLKNAKAACENGYSVFNSAGQVVYTRNDDSNKEQKINVKYRVYANNKWYGEITNNNNVNENGYAGVEHSAIRGLVAQSDKGTLKYRVHIKNGGWLSWISAYNINDWTNGCAGIKTKDIDAVQLDLQGLPGYNVKYRVSTLESNNYLSWITGYNTINSNGYAGIYGQSIDKIQMEIIKV